MTPAQIITMGPTNAVKPHTPSDLNSIVDASCTIDSSSNGSSASDTPAYVDSAAAAAFEGCSGDGLGERAENTQARAGKPVAKPHDTKPSPGHRRRRSRPGMSHEEGAQWGLAQSLSDDLACVQGTEDDGSDVFIMNLHSSIDTRQLYETFRNFGEIVDCKVSTDDRGVSKRCGVIRFSDPRTADEVVRKVNAQ